MMTEASHRLRMESLDHYWKRIWKSLQNEECWYFCENADWALSRGCWFLKDLWRLLQKENSHEEIQTPDRQPGDDGCGNDQRFARLGSNFTYVVGFLLS